MFGEVDDSDIAVSDYSNDVIGSSNSGRQFMESKKVTTHHSYVFFLLLVISENEKHKLNKGEAPVCMSVP